MLPPFGKKPAYNFESADYDLFPSLFGVRAVVVKVAFEFGLAGRFFSLLSRLPRGGAQALKYPVLWMGNWLGGRGSSGGGVQLQWTGSTGAKLTRTVFAPEQGQRMAIVPALQVTEALLKKSHRPGVFSAFEFLGSSALLQGLIQAGFRAF